MAKVLPNEDAIMAKARRVEPEKSLFRITTTAITLSAALGFTGLVGSLCEMGRENELVRKYKQDKTHTTQEYLKYVQDRKNNHYNVLGCLSGMLIGFGTFFGKIIKEDM